MTTDATAWELTAEAEALLTWAGYRESWHPIDGRRDDLSTRLAATERSAVARDRAARGTLTVEALHRAIPEGWRPFWVETGNEDLRDGFKEMEFDRLAFAQAILAALGPVDGIISMPDGAEVLSVGLQHGLVTVWALVDPDALLVSRAFLIAGTGQPCLRRRLGRFIGTVFDGVFVWHVWEEAQP